MLALSLSFLFSCFFSIVFILYVLSFFPCFVL